MTGNTEAASHEHLWLLSIRGVAGLKDERSCMWEIHNESETYYEKKDLKYCMDRFYVDYRS